MGFAFTGDNKGVHTPNNGWNRPSFVGRSCTLAKTARIRHRQRVTVGFALTTSGPRSLLHHRFGEDDEVEELFLHGRYWRARYPRTSGSIRRNECIGFSGNAAATLCGANTQKHDTATERGTGEDFHVIPLLVLGLKDCIFPLVKGTDP